MVPANDNAYPISPYVPSKKSLGTIVLGFYPIWKHYAGLDDAGLDVNNVPTMISEVLHPDALQHLL